MELVGQTIYAVHQVRDGWEIIAPSDDPFTPAYWRVGVIRQDAGARCDCDGPAISQSLPGIAAETASTRLCFQCCAMCGLSYWKGRHNG